MADEEMTRTDKIAYLRAMESDAGGAQPQAPASQNMSRAEKINFLKKAEAQQPMPGNPYQKEFVAPDTAWNKLTQGMAMGYGDELEGLERSAIQSAAETFGLRPEDGLGFMQKYEQERDARRAELDRAGKERPGLSMGAELVGGLATGIAAAPVMGSAAGATAAARLGQAAKVGAAYGAVADPGNEDGINPLQPIERIESAAKGALFGVVLGAGGELAAAGGIKLSKASQGIVKKFNSWIAKDKPNAAAIRRAAEALGVKPTPGMTSSSPVVQNLESSLGQSPSLPGMMVRREQKKIASAMEKGARDLTEDATQLTKFESGEKAKGQIVNKVDEMFKASKAKFNDLREHTKHIKPTQKSIDAVSRNIMKIEEVATFEGGAAASVAKDVVKVLGKRPSANQIKSLRTMVGQKAKAAERAGTGDSRGVWDIYHKLGRLEESTIKRGAIASARSDKDGTKIGKGMLKQLRDAKREYSAGMGKIEKMGLSAKIKARSPGDFNEKIADAQAEKLANKFFDLGNKEVRKKAEAMFPEAYQTLRKSRLSEIKAKSMFKGEVDAGRLIRHVDKLEDEAIKDLFSETMLPKIMNMKTLKESFPDKVGPSGTPQGLMYSDLLSMAARQVTDFGRYALYKTMSNGSIQKLAVRMSKIPEFKNLAESNPKAFNALVINFAKDLERPATYFDQFNESGVDQSKGSK